jgi:hypothetical protein
MEKKIEKVRDDWINQFTNQWDSQVHHILEEKSNAVTLLTEASNRSKKSLEVERDAAQARIQLEYLDQMDELDAALKARLDVIEQTYNDKLGVFLSTNLKTNTLYDSVCSYILQFKQMFNPAPSAPEETISYPVKPQQSQLAPIEQTQSSNCYSEKPPPYPID